MIDPNIQIQGKILIVDDKDNNIQLIGHYLSNDDYDIITAPSGIVALELAEKESPDLILLDVMMPGMDGFITCSKLKENESTRDIPVIFMTAITDSVEKVKGFKLGAVDYITKPFNANELLARVKTHLTLSLLNREIRQANVLLEQRVAERTKELSITNEKLKKEIRERIQTEEALRDNETKFRTLTETTNAGIFILHENKPVYVNSAAEKITGYTKDELTELSLLDLVDSDEKDSISDILNKGNQLGEAHQRTFKIIRKDNSNRWVDCSLRSLISTSLKGVIATFFDITEMKKSEVEIRKLSTAVEQTTISIIITDPEGNIEYVNPTFCELTGYTEQEVIGQTSKILRYEENSDALFSELWNTITQGMNWHGEIQNKKKFGELYWESISISPIKNEKGEITHFLSMGQDITEKKKAENELITAKTEAEEANRLKTNILANMSHEFRTPLNGILGFAAYLEKEVKEDDQIEMVRKIQQSGKRLLTTLSSILQLSQLESKNISTQYFEFNIIDTINKVVNSFESEAINKNISLVYERSSSYFGVYADEQMTNQILVNLLDNAIKYTLEGNVEVKLTTTYVNNEPYAKVLVKDTGIGIEKDKLDVIFNEFRQGSEGLSRRYEGSGLGLTLSRRMAKIMNGDIQVNSTVGEGSEFSLLLPAKEAKGGSKEHSEYSFNEQESLLNALKKYDVKVLYVEDNTENIDVMQFFLKNLCELHTAKKGIEAVELAKANKYDVILLDINLGTGLTGIETMQQIRAFESYDKVPFIAVTGFALSSDRQVIIDSGFHHFLQKPFEQKDLIELLIYTLKAKSRKKITAPDKETLKLLYDMAIMGDISRLNKALQDINVKEEYKEFISILQHNTSQFEIEKSIRFIEQFMN